jgi:holo-[acyl-carrier protein] synthase
VGVDLVEVGRVARLLQKHASAAERLFTESELAYCRARRRRSHEHMAARFAAKEAVFKAFGRGIRQGMRWRDVEVLNEDSGRPRVRLQGNAAAWADQHGLVELDVSLSHTAEIAMAQAVTVWRPVPQ